MAEKVDVRHGDCVEVMRQMDENSVDAVVTDPPYGLEFMGKEWDKLEPARNQQRWVGTERVLIKPAEFKDFKALPTYRPKRNPKCRTCGHYRFSGTPCECEEPDWDHRGDAHASAMQSWHLRWATEALRILKPGGHLLAFGGTRTVHRLTCALEDAGFEIRDTLAWVYGSGFPKSLDVSKAIDKAAGAEREVIGPDRGRLIGGTGGTSTNHGRGGVQYGVDAETQPATDAAHQWSGWGTALKPAHEPIILARKPLSEKNVAANVLRWGTGAINVDGCRIPLGPNDDATKMLPDQHGDQPGNFYAQGGRHGAVLELKPSGRWPANLLLDEEAAAMLDEQSGELKTHSTGRNAPGDYPNNGLFGLEGGRAPYGSSTGGASRFFYVAKASRSERGEGNTHPTVKPVALMRYLCRLVTPPGGVVLDPFLGSGTTALAAGLEGFGFIGIEREEEYVAITHRRLEEWFPLGVR